MTAIPLALAPYPPRLDPPAGGAATVDLLMWRSLDESRRAPIQPELPFDDLAGPRRNKKKPRDTTFDRQPCRTTDLPAAEEFAARMAVAALEIAAGSRPATQAMRHCSPRVFESLVRRQAHRAGRPAVRRAVAVRRVRVCHVRDGIVEATVIVHHAHRVRPIALRIEGLDGRWLVTALEIG